VRAGLLGAGVAVGLVAPLLAVVLVAAVTTVAAMGLKLWSEERASEKHLTVTPGTVFLVGGVAAVAALSQAIGVLLALIAVVGLIVLFFVLGGDLG
jgi:hypothetical protein